MRAVTDPSRPRELLVAFGTLGSIGFGGPAAHIALMRHAVVERAGAAIGRGIRAGIRP